MSLFGIIEFIQIVKRAMDQPRFTIYSEKKTYSARSGDIVRQVDIRYARAHCVNVIRIMALDCNLSQISYFIVFKVMYRSIKNPVHLKNL